MIIGNCSRPFYCLRRGTTIPRKRKKAVLAKSCSGLEAKGKPNHKVINNSSCPWKTRNINNNEYKSAARNSTTLIRDVMYGLKENKDTGNKRK